ncbi:photosystem II stability/assembly factor HCF136 [Scenedesmus sp. NREL 46B-D3]|nr:photosystem II stability/assembly factor HCF136 [Scenedesmus sp. NREL 46B-D3]
MAHATRFSAANTGVKASKFCKAFTAAPSPRGRSRTCNVRAQATADGADIPRRTMLSSAVALGAATMLPYAAPFAAKANKVLSSDWEEVDLPVDKGVVLLDIGFTGSDPNHGFLLGTRQTLLETFDGGNTWQQREIDAARDEGFNYRFQSISFSGDEGWIVGKPAILLHTSDGGKSWERIPLSAKLPGAPLVITALPGEPGQAELTTDQGAIYVTNNKAYTWSAAVLETVDATLNRTVSSGISGASYYEGSFSNIARSPNGDYVAVSSRGNFFMTWTAGQEYWQPHNRPAARRLQNMGWTPSNQLWLSTRGGEVLINNKSGIEEEDYKSAALNSRGFGILDVGYLNGDIAYACGGSGSLFKSVDGGRSWKRDKATDNVAGNLYAIKFFKNNGFILGNDGILLRYIGGTQPNTA